MKELAESVLRDPVFLTIGTDNAGAVDIDQRLVYVGKEEGKLLAIRQLVQEGLRPPVLVFLQSKDRAKVSSTCRLRFGTDHFFLAHPVASEILSARYRIYGVPPTLRPNSGPSVRCPQELFHELVYDGINTDVMHASRTQVRGVALHDYGRSTAVQRHFSDMGEC